MKTPIALVATALLPIALAGCVGPSSALPPNTPAATATKSTEQNGKFIALVGPRRAHGEPFLGVPDTNFDALRSWIDTRTGETVHQLYVEDSYFGAERNWEAARIQAGESLRFIPISKNKITCDNGCSYAEEFAATLPEALLRASTRGLAISFTAHSGAEQTILVPGELILEQLAAVDAARAGP
ncbi:MAG: hypothetical protein WA459_23315, partial [Stellaceae bacterium]